MAEQCPNCGAEKDARTTAGTRIWYACDSYGYTAAPGKLRHVSAQCEARGELRDLKAQVAAVYALGDPPPEQSATVPISLAEWVTTRFVKVSAYNALATRWQPVVEAVRACWTVTAGALVGVRQKGAIRDAQIHVVEAATTAAAETPDVPRKPKTHTEPQPPHSPPQ